MTTQSTQKTGADISALLGSLVEKQAFQDKETAEVIRQDNYDAASTGTFVLSSALESQINSPELMDILRQDPTPRRLNLIMIAAEYLSNAKTEEDKKMVIELVKTTNSDDLLKVLSLEISGKLTPEEEARILNLKLQKELGVAKEKTLLGEFECSRLEGKLGEGISIKIDDSYHEHRTLTNGAVLRVQKTGDSYQAIIQLDDVKMKKNSYGKFKMLVSIVNNLFEKDFKFDIKEYLRASEKIEFTLGDANKVSEEGYAIVRTNFVDNYFSRGTFFECNTVNMSSALMGILGLIIAPIGLAQHSPQAVQIGSALLGYGAANGLWAIKDDEHMGLVERLYYGPKRKKDKKKLQTSKLLEDISNKLKIVNGEEDIEVDFDSFKKESDKCSKMYDELTSNFSKLGECKGFVIEYSSKSLEEIYSKAYQIVESININSK